MTLASSWALGTNKEGQSLEKRSTVEVKGGSGNIITSFHHERTGLCLAGNDVYNMEL